jgi:hypothetical protein
VAASSVESIKGRWNQLLAMEEQVVREQQNQAWPKMRPSQPGDDTLAPTFGND